MIINLNPCVDIVSIGSMLQPVTRGSLGCGSSGFGFFNVQFNIPFMSSKNLEFHECFGVLVTVFGTDSQVIVKS